MSLPLIGNIRNEVFGLVNRVVSVLIELNMTSLDMLVQLIPYKDSGCIKQEYVGIRTRKGRYAIVLTDRILDLSRFSTNKDRSKTL